MSNSSALDREPLKTIPLFRGLDDAELDKLVALFVSVAADKGVTIFEAGSQAEFLYILASGEVTLDHDPETRQLTGPAVIGELGAIGKLDRLSTATAGADAALWKVAGDKLAAFFDENPRIGLRVQHNLLEIVADKVDRDQSRIDDMRQNIIRTQKAMKRVRDFLLESDDTAVSEFAHDQIEAQIKRNRRVNYRVKPPTTLAATVKMDDGRRARVLEISRTHVSFQVPEGDLPAADARTSGVLELSGPEIVFSGKVLRTRDRRVDVELDLLVDDYSATLEGYLTRLQMLDVLV
jgi:CRP-like cAMP-binding protein